MISALEAFEKSLTNKKATKVPRDADKLVEVFHSRLLSAISGGHTRFSCLVKHHYVKTRLFRSPILSELGEQIFSEFINAGYIFKIQDSLVNNEFYVEVNWDLSKRTKRSMAV